MAELSDHEIIRRINVTCRNNGWRNGADGVAVQLLHDIENCFDPLEVCLERAMPNSAFVKANGISVKVFRSAIAQSLKGHTRMKKSKDSQPSNITVNANNVMGVFGSVGSSATFHSVQIGITAEELNKLLTDEDVRKVIASDLNHDTKVSKLREILLKRMPSLTVDVATQAAGNLLALGAGTMFG